MRIEEIEKRLSGVDAKLEKLQRERTAWLTAISVHERCKSEPIGEFPESAYRAYIISGTVADAAYMLNNDNQRNGARKFIPNDISETIDNIPTLQEAVCLRSHHREQYFHTCCR